MDDKPEEELTPNLEEESIVKQCRLEISGIPEKTLKEDLDDFLEGQDLTGELNVVVFNERLHTAIVECTLVEAAENQNINFDILLSTRDAEKILQNQPFPYSGSTLNVCVEKEKPPNRCVRITGFSSDYDEDKLKYFFQSKKRGGEIESIDLQPGEIALVTFRDHNVAKKVVEKEKFRRGEDTLTVCWHTTEEEKEEQDEEQPKCSNAVCIYGLPPRADKELLEDLLEGQNLLLNNITIENFDKKEDHFLVTFSKACVVDELLQKKILPFGENELQFSLPIEEKNVQKDVLIKGLPNGFTKEELKVFFQSKRKTNGGPIQSISVNDMDHTAQIVFCDARDALNVVERGRFTRQNGTTFYAEWFEKLDAEHCDEDPNTILLFNFNQDIDMDSLEDFLEDITKERVQGMHTNPAENWTKVSFESTKGPEKAMALARDNILEVGPMRFSLRFSPKHDKTKPREDLQVERKFRECHDLIKFVEVSGIPVGTSEEFLKLFLESKEKSGGGEVDEIRYDTTTGRAFVTFIHEKDADDIVIRTTYGNLTFNKSKIKAVKRQEKELPHLNTCAIVVSGIPESYSEENLMDAFENERYGGGPVEDIHMDNQRIVITFENPSIAANVVNLAQKSPIELEKHVLKIEPLPTPKVATSPEPDENPKEVFIENIPENSTREELQDYLEKNSPYDVDNVIYGMKVGTAEVTVSPREETCNDPWKEVRMKPMSGSMLSIEYVPFSKSIEVYGYQDTTETKLRNYFESRRCIPQGYNRGKVVHLQHLREHSCIVITFDKVEEADHVLERGEHVTEGKHLNVKKHSEKLGILPDTHNENIPAKSIPADMKIEIKDSKVFAFIQKNKGEYLQELLKNKQAGMEFIDDQMEIKLTFETDSKSSTANHSWTKDVQVLVNQFISSFTSMVVEISLQTKEAQKILQKFVRDILQDNAGKDIEITIDNACIQIAGEANLVSDIEQRVQKKVSETMEYCKMLADRTTATIKLTETQRGYLAWKQCLKGIEEKYKMMKMSVQHDKAVMEGCNADVQAAKMDVHEILSAIHTVEQPWCTKSVIALLKRRKILDKLMMHCRQRKCAVYMHLHREEKLYLMGESLHDIEDAAMAIRNEIEEHSIPVTRKHGDDILDKLERFIESLDGGAGGEFLLSQTKRDQVTIIGLKASVANAKVKIDNFLEANERLEDYMRLTFGQNRLINLNSQEMEAIQIRCGVRIQIKHTANGSGILLCGNTKNLAKGKQAILDLWDNVATDSYPVLSAGMKKYYLTSTNRLQMEQLEQEYKVAVFPVDGQGEPIKSSTLQAERHIATKLDKLNLSLGKGNPWDYPCDSVFVMIQENWNHSPGISTEIVRLGGTDLHAEIDKEKGSSNRLFPGTAFITETGVNRCKQIVHCVEGKSDELFNDAIFQGLKEALSKGHQLINIPLPIGSNSSAPAQIETVFKAIECFSERYRDVSTVSEIRLIAEGKQYKQLEKIFKNEFKKNLFKKLLDVEEFSDQNDDTPITTSSPITLNLMKGELVDANADVIVNSTSSTMDLSQGAVSSSLLRAGGKTLQEQCRQYMKQRGLSTVSYFEIVPTDGGQLKCQCIYHASLDQYRTAGGSEKDLEEFLLKCLKQATSNGYKSIAFPALGTGNLAFPKPTVARLMLETVQAFSRNNPSSSLKRVDIILWPKDPETIQAFESKERELKASPASTDVHMPTGIRHPKTEHKLLSTHGNPDAGKGAVGATGGSRVLFYKDVKLEIVQGDITCAGTDGIVYSTDKSFSFGSAIGKVLRGKGGQALVDACKIASWSEGVAVTDGQFLGCKHLFHVDAPTQKELDDWKKRIIKCLELAEHRKLESIAFPAIGTGMSRVNPSKIAGYMIDGIEEFVSKSKSTHLKSIKMVIFDQGMLQQFESQLKRIASNTKKQAQGWRWDIIGAVTSLLGFGGSDNSDGSYESDGDVEEEEEEETYSDGPTQILLKLMALQSHAHNLTQVKGRLGRITEQKLKLKRIDGTSDSEDIRKLTDKQVHLIKRLERKHDVTIRFNKTTKKAGNYIEIEGLSDDVSDVAEAIHRQFRAADKEKEKAVLFEKINWQYQRDDSEFENYSMNENFEIEEAYNNLEGFITIKRTGCKVEIDVINMIESVSDGSVTSRVIRRYAPGEVTLPPDWSEMKPKQRFIEVEIKLDDKNTSGEFELVYNEFKQSMLHADRYTKTFKEVVKIKRIQNPMQYKRYDMHKKHMLKPNEQPLLWHGTSTDTLTQIITNGFNRSYAGVNATLYGKGTYFSKYAGYSHSYAKQDAQGLHHMLLCRVLVGDYTKGDPVFIDTPAKDPAKPAIKYDSVVDDISNPTMYVVFTDTQAYPDYLITYKT